MSHAPFLLIDAGNSRVKWALVRTDGSQTHGGAFAHGEAVGASAGGPATTVSGLSGVDASDTPDASDTSDPPAPAMSGTGPDSWPDLPAPAGAWISNVAGAAVARRIDTLIDAHWPGLPRTTIRAVAQQCGVTNGYATPSSLGSDRWAGLIGAHAAFPVKIC